MTPTDRRWMAIGTTIQRLRQSGPGPSRLTQEVLARRAGISPNYLSQIERGAREPRVSILFRLADALGVSLCTLVPGEGIETEGGAEIALLLKTIRGDRPLTTPEVRLLRRIAEAMKE